MKTTPTARHAALGWGIIIALLLVVKLFVIDPANTKMLGIGVSRQSVQSYFERSDLGFSVDTMRTLNGQTVVVLYSPRGSIGILELVGPPRALNRASISVGTPVDGKHALYLAAFLHVTAMTWQDGPKWVDKNLGRAKARDSVTTTLQRPDRIVSLRYSSRSGVFTLSIAPDL